MPRYIHTARIAAATGLVTLAALAMSAAPAGAHIVCPPGVTDPAFCSNLPPLALTLPANPVASTTATLNGVIDGYGDTTQYFFQYGTSTAYGSQTPTLTAPECPPGTTNPNYCVGSGLTFVTAPLTGLAPDTTYHFRVVSQNPDGTSDGADHAFTTAQVIFPIQFVHAPHRVRGGRRFTVVVGLRTSAAVTIDLLSSRGNVVRSFDEGTLTGTFQQRIRAPFRRGRYVISVTATGGGTTQTVRTPIRVIRGF